MTAASCWGESDEVLYYLLGRVRLINSRLCILLLVLQRQKILMQAAGEGVMGIESEIIALKEQADLRSELDRLRPENERLQGCIEDDEPITAEWWQSIGGEKRNGGNWLQPNGQSPLMPLLVVLRLSLDEQDVSLWIDDRMKWHELALPAVRTRGDVRQLVRLLGRE